MKTGKDCPTSENNIYLIGFMGAGKTTVGKILAEKMKREFLDTDAIIERQLGASISQIFSNRGESFFRNVESRVVKDVAKNKGAVIALGGGSILRPDNWEAVSNSGISVYLKWDIRFLLPRILGDATRPLMSHGLNNSGRTEIERILVQREAFYKRSDIILECENYMVPTQIADKILTALQEGR